MPRSGKFTKRQIEPDPIFGNRLLNRFINKIMEDGKKSIAQKLVYKTLDRIKEKNPDPVRIFETAIANVGPRMEVRPRRIGGASYQVPQEVRGDRRQALAIRWIVEAARKRPNKEFPTFDQKLAVEIWDASQNQGEAIKKRDNTLRMAEANRAFAHFRW